MSISPGTWEFKPFAFTDEVQKQMEAVGIKPTRVIGNDGGVSVMTTDGDNRKLIATVASQTEFKRGKGNEVDCPERDINARAESRLMEAENLLSQATDFIESIKVGKTVSARNSLATKLRVFLTKRIP